MPKKGMYTDLTGNKYNGLFVESLNCHKNRKYYWNCICVCGNKTVVEGSKLKNGHTKSCGCYAIAKIKELNKKTGMSKTRLYYTYRNMLNRCFYKEYALFADYGGRGITVCETWLGSEGFSNFAKWSLDNGYKEGLTLDRIDVNGIYEPKNCRWVDIYTQANNKRNNRFITINGETDTVANMARKYNVSYWNLLHYSKGGQNCKYPDLEIGVPHGR